MHVEADGCIVNGNSAKPMAVGNGKEHPIAHPLAVVVFVDVQVVNGQAKCCLDGVGKQLPTGVLFQFGLWTTALGNLRLTVLVANIA